MTTSDPNGQSTTPAIPGETTLRQIRFVQNGSAGQDVLLEFADPISQKAVCILPGSESKEKNPGTGASDGIDVLISAEQPREHLGGNDELLKWVMASTLAATTPIAITMHGAQVIWGTSRAAILAAPDRVNPFLLALVDFCYYESELRKLEREISENWPLLEMDIPLAYDVAEHDPERFEGMGQRMEQALKRRIRLARIAPHLVQPRPHLSPLANQLMDRLREKAHLEARYEALSSQLDVFERIYEMNSQRVSDFKSARQQRTLEWVIIVLLAAETLLILIEILWSLGI